MWREVWTMLQRKWRVLPFGNVFDLWDKMFVNIDRAGMVVG
jgi:hypothetical protein